MARLQLLVPCGGGCGLELIQLTKREAGMVGGAAVLGEMGG